jgi:hypothetical protein
MMGKRFERFRSSVTGKLVSALFAKLNPRETYKDTMIREDKKKEAAVAQQEEAPGSNPEK